MRREECNVKEEESNMKKRSRDSKEKMQSRHEASGIIKSITHTIRGRVQQKNLPGGPTITSLRILPLSMQNVHIF